MQRCIYLLLLLILIAACEPEEWSKPGNLVPLTADQDSSIPSLQINGTLLHVETYGNSADPLLVVIHGGPGEDFRACLNAKDFSHQGYYVIFYDQRGTGLSKREDKSQFEGPEAIQLFIDDLHALIEHHKTTESQKVFLFGHSWGAMLATAYINQNPEKISGAVLAEPGGFTWPQTKDYLSRSNKAKFFGEGINDMLSPEEILAGRSDHEILDYKASFSADFSNAPGNTSGNAGYVPFWRFGAVAAMAMGETADKYGFDFTTNLSQYQNEILFLYSEKNRAYGESWALEVSAAYPNVQLDIVKNSGHEMPYFGWADMFPKTLNYLNQLK